MLEKQCNSSVLGEGRENAIPLVIAGSIGGLQAISRGTDNNAALCTIAGGRTKVANEKSFLFVHQHGGYDIT